MKTISQYLDGFEQFRMRVGNDSDYNLIVKYARQAMTELVDSVPDKGFRFGPLDISLKMEIKQWKKEVKK